MKMTGAVQFLDKLAARTARKSPADSELIVIDWAEDSSLLLHLDVSGTPRIKRFAHLKFDPSMSLTDRRAAYSQFLSGIPKKNLPKAVLCWSEGMTFRQLQLPAMPQDDLLKALDWDLKKKFYFNKEENLLGYKDVMEVEGEEEPERLFSIYYCENKTALPRLDFVFGLGLQVQMLIPGPMAMAYHAASGGPADADKDVLVCELKENLVRIVVARGNNSMMVRNVSLFVPDGVWTDAVLEKVAEELRKTIDFYESQKYARPISKVLLGGERSGSVQVLDLLAARLHMAVIVPPVEGYLSGALDAADRERATAQPGLFMTAIGAAMAPDNTMNLVPMDVKIKNRQGRLNRLLNLGLAGFGLVLIFLAVFTAVQLNWTTTRQAALRSELDVLNANQKVLQSLLDRSRVHYSALKGDVPLHALMKDISLRAPSAIVFKRVQFNRQEGSMTVSGECLDAKRDGSRSVSQFVTSLGESPFFSSVNVTSQQEDEATKALTFEIAADLKGISA